MKPTFKLRYFTVTPNRALLGFVDKPDYCNEAWNTFRGISIGSQVAVDGQLELGELYELNFMELTKVPRPVWIPEKGEKVMVRNKREWFRRYSFGKLDEYNNLLCYSHGMDEWSGFDETDPCDWREWRKPTNEELK